VLKALGAAGNGDPLLVLGLTGENMARLMAGEPMRVDVGRTLGGPPMQVLLCGGETEEAIAEELRKWGLLQ
jgi:hypothetical protein